MPASLREVIALKYGPVDRWGWGPRLRTRFGYSTPDDRYEAFMLEHVDASTVWLDVGCGRHIFPGSDGVAKLLAGRCRLLAGLDPNDNIDENPFLHRRSKSSIQDYRTDIAFDLVSLRMVAEHIREPQTAVHALARLVKPGGLVVIYTVWKWAPVSIIAAITPMWVHHAVKRVVWGVSERDTFPVEYRMNTRRKLNELFRNAGFQEETFEYLDDCGSSTRSRMLNTLELSLQNILSRVGIRYPERCILASYRKAVGT